MIKEEFDLIKNSLQKRIDNCEKYLGGIKTREDLLCLSLQQIIEMKNFCDKEYNEMTEIAMVDLYHVIGMGNLTPTQMTKFVFMIKRYLSFRPDMKNFHINLSSINNLPNIPTKQKFNLHMLCNLELKCNCDENEDANTIMDDTDESEIEKSTINDYQISHKANMINDKEKDYSNITLPFTLIRECRKIVMKVENLDEFFALRKLFKCEAPEDTKEIFKAKVLGNGTFFGILWKSDGDLVTGIIKTRPLLNSFIKLVENCKENI